MWRKRPKGPRNWRPAAGEEGLLPAWGRRAAFGRGFSARLRRPLLTRQPQRCRRADVVCVTLGYHSCVLRAGRTPLDGLFWGRSLRDPFSDKLHVSGSPPAG